MKHIFGNNNCLQTSIKRQQELFPLVQLSNNVITHQLLHRDLSLCPAAVNLKTTDYLYKDLDLDEAPSQNMKPHLSNFLKVNVKCCLLLKTLKSCLFFMEKDRLSGKQVGSQATYWVTQPLARIQHVRISVNQFPAQ